MARTGALIGVAALVGLGIWAAVPNDEPRYLGDMPSMLEQAEAEASPLQPEPPRPPAPVEAGPLGPRPVGVEAPAAPGPRVPGGRVPAPLSDAPPDYSAGGATGDDVGPMPGSPEFLPGLGPLD